MKKLDDLTCREILRRAHILSGGGLGLLVLDLLLLAGYVPPAALTALLLVAGAALTAVGLGLAFSRLRCPHCGESLMLGGRLPTRLPKHCPGCGKEL